MKKFKFIVLIFFSGMILCSTLQARSTSIANSVTAAPEQVQSAHLFHMEQYRDDLNPVKKNVIHNIVCDEENVWKSGINKAGYGIEIILHSAGFNNQFATLFVPYRIKETAKVSGAGL